MVYKTPGVYVKEISTFPPSVVSVETAIPAFIGYTEKAIDADGNYLTMVPTRIKSLLDFESYFGGDYRPATYQVQLDTSNNTLETVTPLNSSNTQRRYYLYGCLRHFYANGGGPCYIVSVGSYSDDPSLGDTTTPAGLEGGLFSLQRFDEPTLLVFPDGVSLTAVELGSLQGRALAQCEKLQDRFVIMDLHQGNLAPSISLDPAEAFRNGVSTNNLKYGAAYYPWLQTIYRTEVHFRHLSFVDLLGGSIPNTTLEELFDETEINQLVTDTIGADAAVETVVTAVSGTANSSDLTLTQDNFAELVTHFAHLLDLLRQISVPPSDPTFDTSVRQQFTNLLLLPRAIARAMPTLDADASTSIPEELNQAIANLRGDSNLRAAIVALIALEKNTDVMTAVDSSRTASNVVTDYAAFNESTEWLEPNADNVQAVISAVNISELDRDNFAAMTEHFEDLLELLRQIPAPPTGGDPDELAAFESSVRERFGNLLLLPRAIALAMQTLDERTTTSPENTPEELNQAVASLKGDSDLRAAIVALIALEKNSDVMSAVADGRTTSDVVNDYAAFNASTEWIEPNPNIDDDNIPANTVDFGTDLREIALNAAAALQGPFDTLSAAILLLFNSVDVIPANTEDFGTDLHQIALNAAAALQGPFDTLSAAIVSLFEVTEFLANEAEKKLFANHPVMKAAVEKVQRTMSILPISGAVAGIYAAVDRTRGVWKAPANVSIADVVGPAVKINDADQETLNVHTTGKSINAIRAFTGKGTLVWGARTLAGNDNEWRYVPVRRFFNMAEESIKKATEPFVFEPNDANTWVRVRAMIENFLTLQWRAGALVGAKTEQAFYVKVGLGETMTAQDILEGRMIVEIGMAVVRPAEFIILKFAHKMQVS